MKAVRWLSLRILLARAAKSATLQAFCLRDYDATARTASIGEASNGRLSLHREQLSCSSISTYFFLLSYGYNRDFVHAYASSDLSEPHH